MKLFGALVYQIIGQQISVIAATGNFRSPHRAVRRSGAGSWRARGCGPWDTAWSRTVPA